MDTENSRKKNAKQKTAEEPDSGSDAEQSAMERGAEVLDQAEKAVADAYHKTAQTVSGTYDQVMIYSSSHPGRTLLIALGIGAGLGFFLGAGSRRLRTGRIARPVVNALSDIALEFFG